MKKLVLMLVAASAVVVMGCQKEAEAFDNIEFANDFTIAQGGLSIGYDQSGDEISIGVGGIGVYHSTGTELGISYNTPLIAGLSGSAHYEYAADEDHIVGIDTAIKIAGVSIDTGLDWNVTEEDLTAALGTSYAIAGIDGSVTSNWGISDFGYNGLDIDAGYTWKVSDRLSVRPNVTVPVDSDNEWGDVTAGLSVSFTFGGSSTD